LSSSKKGKIHIAGIIIEQVIARCRVRNVKALDAGGGQ
jgi:hypothetical protein